MGMKMKTKLLGLSLALAFTSSAAFSADCGEAPYEQPPIPNGETADAEDIRKARVAVVTYSNKVDEYLTCMDQRAPRILPYLSKEQKVRWDEDLAEVHERRRELQTQMNQAIRAFRKKTAN